MLTAININNQEMVDIFFDHVDTNNIRLSINKDKINNPGTFYFLQKLDASEAKLSLERSLSHLNKLNKKTE